MRNSEKNLKFRLTTDIQLLRKGSGLAVVRLRKVATLQLVAAKHIGIDPAVLSAPQLRSFLLLTVQAMGETIEVRALRNAFAIGKEDDPQNLTTRRMSFAQQHDKHPDTIELYENRAIAQLVDNLLVVDSQTISLRPSRSPSHSKEMGSEVAARNMISQGLADIYGLGSHAAEAHRLFGKGNGAYLDADVECLLLPSPRGKGWYIYKMRTTFRAQKANYRVAIVTTAHDSEALMASGIVDDTIKLDSASSFEREMPTILNNCGFIVHDAESGLKEPLPFTELGQSARSGLLSELWQVDDSGCRIIAVDIPEKYRESSCIYEYRWSIELPINGEQYAYWSSPGLMYLKTITIDAMRFPNRKRWHIYIQPFLGAINSGAFEPDGDFYVLTAGTWITRGHGIMLTWRPADPV